jgi:hypothetical protein
MGFDTYNPILNCGGLYLSLSFISIVMGAFILFIIVTKMVMKMVQTRTLLEGGENRVSRRMDACLSKTKSKCSKLFFNPLILMFGESLLQIYISVLLFFKMPEELRQI